ncbi:MAG: type II secretion system protein [Phycisphaerales bacterium]|nr:type II secretion system protein [Phycisphaerales bacterium]
MNHRRAFTVLELVVVIGIILILMSLALTVSSAVLAANDRRSMENTFRMLEQAVESWQAQTGRDFSFGRRVNPPNTPVTLDFTLGGNGPSASFDFYEENFNSAYAICVVLERLSANPDSAEILSRIPGSALRTVPLTPANVIAGEPLPTNWVSAAAAIDPNQMPNPIGTNPSPIREIVDPWGRRVMVAFAGRAATPSEILAATTGTPAAIPPIDLEDGSVRTMDEQRMGVCRNRRMCFISCGQDGDGDTAADNVYSYELLPRPVQ